jgi:glycosyltransferase involved in cell wall biosynthesis
LGGRAARVPVVVNTVHGLYATDDDSWARRVAVYGVERLAATCSDAELVQNEEDVSTLAKLHVPADRLHLLGNGIDLERFAPGPKAQAARGRIRAELGVDDATVVVGAVGRLVWEKGYGELFAAAGELRRRCPEVTVVVAGPHEPEKADGIGPAELAAAESSGVRFLGHRSDVEDIYPAFDMYVLASYREGFPRSAMEAAAMGLPVIATDIRGCRQVVEHGVNGLLVPPRNAGALTDAVVRLAGDPELRTTMRSEAVAKAKRDFDQRHVIATTLAVYDELLERKARGVRTR